MGRRRGSSCLPGKKGIRACGYRWRWCFRGGGYFLLNNALNAAPRCCRSGCRCRIDKRLENFSILHISDLHGARFGREQENLAG